MEALLVAIDRLLPLDPISRARFRIPANEGSLIHQLHEQANVLTRHYKEDACEIEADVPESLRQRLARYSIE